jgi:hypothetical protein
VAFLKTKADKRILTQQRRRAGERAVSIDPRNIAQRVLTRGNTPLEIMCEHVGNLNMEARRLHKALSVLDPEDDPQLYSAMFSQYAERAHGVIEAANKVAPYLHPKLTSTEIWVDKESPTTEANKMSSAAELRALLRGPGKLINGTAEKEA